MSNSYVLKNVGQGVVSFRVQKPIGDFEGLPKHKRRKLIRNAIADVSIGRSHSLDLVQELDLPAEVVAELPEVVAILTNPNVLLLKDLIADTAKAADRAKVKEEAEDAAKQAEIDAQTKAQQEALDAEANAEKESEEKSKADKPSKKKFSKKGK